MLVRWTNNKKVCFVFCFFHLAGNQPASFGNLQGKSQSSWQWPLKCSTVLKHCIFPGHILWYKQKRKRRRKMTVVLLFVEIKQLFFAVSLYQTCRHNPKMTWTDCEDGLIKDCCVCRCLFHILTSIITWKRAFPPAALCSSQFSHKNHKETSKSAGYFPFNSKWDCLVVCLKCRVIQIVYSQRFCFMSPV